jgi:hypothetical protein
MAAELSRKMKRCIAAGTGCAGAYGIFGSMLPKARDRAISLKEALDMALSPEETLCESYFEEVRNNKGDSRSAAALQTLLRSHLEKIREFRSKRGFSE